jgi:hypothetical protein
VSESAKSVKAKAEATRAVVSTEAEKRIKKKEETDEEFDQVEQQQARESVGIEESRTSQEHAGEVGESAGALRQETERKECHVERGGAHDPGIKRLQQLDVGDMEPDRKVRLKDKEIGDSTVGEIERDRREVIAVGLKSNG